MRRRKLARQDSALMVDVDGNNSIIIIIIAVMYGSYTGTGPSLSPRISHFNLSTCGYMPPPRVGFTLWAPSLLQERSPSLPLPRVAHPVQARLLDWDFNGGTGDQGVHSVLLIGELGGLMQL